MPDSVPLRNRFGAGDEIAHPWVNLIAETTAIEDAIMTGARLDIEFFHILGDVGAQAVRGLRLADTGNVVLLTFDCHKGDVGYGGGVDLTPIVDQFTLGQGEFLEHQIDGLKVKLFGHVQNGQIFVIEFKVLIDTVAIAANQ